MIRPADVAREVCARRCRSDEPVQFYWVTVTHETKPSGRGAFVDAMKPLVSSEPVCAVALRVNRFTHPDMVMHDLADTLAEIKSEVLALPLRRLVEETGSLDVVVVSRMSFDLAINTSPLHLPVWFPVSPGREVKAPVIDLTLRVKVPLSDFDTGELCRLLFELDQALLRRVQIGLRTNPQLVNSFLDQLMAAKKRKLDGGQKAPTYADELVAVKERLDVVRNPRDFRPSIAKNPTLVGRIWCMSNVKTIDGLGKFAKSLSRAAQIEPGKLDDFHEALLPVLARPSDGLSSMDARWAYNLILSVQAACRVITAAAHADDYGEYPAWLLRSMSLDLRKSLADAVARTQAEPEPANGFKKRE